MFARMTTAHVKTGQVHEAARVYRERIEPNVRTQKGWKASLYFISPEADKAVSITLWDTEADMLATESGGFYREQVAKIEHLFAAPPVREHYEVAIQAR